MLFKAGMVSLTFWLFVYDFLCGYFDISLCSLRVMIGVTAPELVVQEPLIDQYLASKLSMFAINMEHISAIYITVVTY